MTDQGSARSLDAVGSSAVARVEQLVDTVNDLVPEADNGANAVMADNSRTIRWAGPLFAMCALALAPWIIVIALTLPSRQLSPNYDIAWAGFDVLLFAALASTAGSALRRSHSLASAASWSSALLVTDAWFDVMTSPSGLYRLEAIGMACVVELPLAATCLWLTHHTEDITERRLRLMLRRRGAPPAT